MFSRMGDDQATLSMSRVKLGEIIEYYNFFPSNNPTRGGFDVLVDLGLSIVEGYLFGPPGDDSSHQIKHMNECLDDISNRINRIETNMVAIVNSINSMETELKGYIDQAMFQSTLGSIKGTVSNLKTYMKNPDAFS